jgi:hypothetical protein
VCGKGQRGREGSPLNLLFIVTLVMFLIFGVLFPFYSLSAMGQGVISSNYNLDATIELTGETYTRVFSVTVGDPDNDGTNEILANYDWYVHEEENPNIPATAILEKSGDNYEVEDLILNFTMQVNMGMCKGLFHIVVGDADNDGENEILMPGELDGEQGIYLYKYDGHEYNLIWSELGSSYKDGEIYDINMDGLNELIVPGLGILQWQNTEFVQLASLGSSEGVRVGDTDGDGEKEIILATGSLGIEVYKWEDDQLVLHGSASKSGYISCGFGVADSDGDGMEEVLRVEYHNTMVVFGWNGEGYVAEWEGQTPENDNPVTAWAGDADDDSVGELYVGNGNYAYGLSILQYEHSEGDYPSTWNASFSMYCYSITIGDSDNDGNNELIGGSGSNGRLYIYSRTPSLTPRMTVKAQAFPEEITGDGESTIDIYVKCADEGLSGVSIDLHSMIGGTFTQVTYSGDGHYTTKFIPPDFTESNRTRILVNVTKNGYLSDSSYTSIYYWAGDSDNDGYPNDQDDFPNDPAASKDSDGDGHPDEWNSGESENTSTTGLTLDAFPNDPTQWSDTDGDSYGDNPMGENPDDYPYDPDRWLAPDEESDSFWWILISIIISVIILVIIVVMLWTKTHKGLDSSESETLYSTSPYYESSYPQETSQGQYQTQAPLFERVDASPIPACPYCHYPISVTPNGPFSVICPQCGNTIEKFKNI